MFPDNGKSVFCYFKILDLNQKFYSWILLSDSLDHVYNTKYLFPGQPKEKKGNKQKYFFLVAFPSSLGIHLPVSKKGK